MKAGVLVDIKTSPVSYPHEIRAEMEVMKQELADYPEILARVMRELECNLEIAEELHNTAESAA
nr:MAG TPA: hypothetical protein [Caudoviricetes sp.]